MIHFNLLAPILLCFFTWAFPTSVIAGIWTHQLDGNNLLAGCKFNLGTRGYDLCPLLEEHLAVGGNTEKGGTEEAVIEYEFTLTGSASSSTVRALNTCYL